MLHICFEGQEILSCVRCQINNYSDFVVLEVIFLRTYVTDVCVWCLWDYTSRTVRVSKLKLKMLKFKVRKIHTFGNCFFWKWIFYKLWGLNTKSFLTTANFMTSQLKIKQFSIVAEPTSGFSVFTKKFEQTIILLFLSYLVLEVAPQTFSIL